MKHSLKSVPNPESQTIDNKLPDIVFFDDNKVGPNAITVVGDVKGSTKKAC